MNEELRIDSQYFKKKYLAEDASLRKFENIPLGSFAFITDSPHGYHVVDAESDIAMLTAKCAKQWFSDRSQADTIDLATHQSSLCSSLAVNENGGKISSNPETAGRYHSNWLNMMYPRLKLARNLLMDDGVIFISIDDNEQASLKKTCDELFGEGNFIAHFVWQKNMAL